MRLLVTTAFVLASTALATPTFTGTMQTELMMSGPPPGVCAVCHTNGVTASGTVTTPFGRALRMNGLMPNNEASLRMALTALDTAMTDSDMDGCTDIAELKANPPTNPNRAGDCTQGTGGGAAGGGGAGGGGPDIGPIRYGCGANVVPGLAVVVAALAFARRRR